MKKKKDRQKFNWKKFALITGIVLGVLSVLTVIMCVGTDITKKEFADILPFEAREALIEATEYGYKITYATDDPIRILQLTDIHIGGGLLSIRNDKMAIKAVRTLIEHARPDLVIVTGDLVYPVPFQSGTINNMIASKIFGELMEKFGIPWVLTFGNHDSEPYSLYKRSELTEYYSGLKNCLLVRGPEDIYGYGNQIITLHNSDGELNTALVLMDSNDYIKGRFGINIYDKIHDDQVEWYVDWINKLSEGKEELVQSMMFIHIPFEEYATAWDLYKAGSDEVKHFFGELREEVCHPDVESNIFEAIVNLGSTVAVFCGHDHVNDFSIEYEGVRLTYGKSIDYLAYAFSGIINKTEQRGATLIEINSDKSYDISTIRYSDIQG
jgi:predicted phosphodiesterase